jgi:glutamate-1-semialdehyde 2,1-aminomutase
LTPVAERLRSAADAVDNRPMLASTARPGLDRRADRRLVPGSQNFLTIADDPSFPRFASHGQGAYLWDVEGTRFVDLFGGSGAIILGHAHEEQSRRVNERVRAGAYLGFRHPLEVEIAEWLQARIVGAERCMFFKTGSEASHAAAVVGTRHTGRRITVAVGYHGWLPPFTGYPNTDDDLVRRVDSSDMAGALDAIATTAADLASVIVAPDPGVLDQDMYIGLARATRDAGAIFVMDEIKTACRAEFPTLSSALGLQPDLLILGKAISNGFPLAVLCGPDEILGRSGAVDLFSTFAGETVSLVATHACLELLEAGAYDRFRRASEWLYRELRNVLAGTGFAVAGHPTYFRLETDDGNALVPFAARLREEGVLLHPFDAVSASAAHDEEAVLDEIAAAFSRAARKVDGA